MKIAQYIGGSGSWGDVSPTTMKEKGLGGRESALVHLSENWAKQGHEVINFVPTGETHYYQHGSGSSTYISNNKAGAYIKDFKVDVFVSWEEPRILGVPELRRNMGLAIIEMQVSNMSTSPEIDAVTDAYAVLSPWAGEWLCTQEPNINPEKLVVFPNGVDITRYNNSPVPGYKNHSDSPKFYYSSSPDRGLNHLLKMWPQIRSEFKDAELHVAYGFEHWAYNIMWSHNMQAEAALDVIEGVKQEGVIYHGKIGQNELAAIQESCDALLYPCDTMQPTETGCITVVEAGAALSPAVLTDCDCLPTEFAETALFTPLPLDVDEYIDQIIRLLEDDNLYITLQHNGRALAEARHWPLIANKWLKFFEESL